MRCFTDERIAVYANLLKMKPSMFYWLKPEHLTEQLITNILANERLLDRLRR